MIRKADYSVKKTIRKEKEETPIIVTEGEDLELYCNECNFKLLHTGKDHFMCGRCGVEYIPERELVKHGSGLETWDGPVDEKGNVDTETRVSELPEPDYTRKKERKLKGGFKALEEGSGTLRFTDYVTNEREEEDENAL